LEDIWGSVSGTQATLEKEAIFSGLNDLKIASLEIRVVHLEYDCAEAIKELVVRACPYKMLRNHKLYKVLLKKTF